MNIFPNRTFKGVILAAAIINIVVMMLFEYGLPSPVALASEINSEDLSGQNTDTGTIESVEKENAAKEAEALETALALPLTHTAACRSCLRSAPGALF